MDDITREKAAADACESRMDLIMSMGIKDTRAMLRAAFYYGRAFGLTEAGGIFADAKANGPSPSL